MPKRKNRSSSFFTPFNIAVFMIVAAVIGAAAMYINQQQSFNDRGRAASPTLQPGLKVNGATVTSMDGNRFVFKGVNVEYFRDSGCKYVTDNTTTQKEAIVNKMKTLGINAVRVNYKASWLDDEGNMTKFLDLMQLMAQNGMYPMPSDHTFTGKTLTGYNTASFPMFKAIVEGARARGFEDYLVMNPYNEPYGTDQATSTWTHWATTNNDTLSYLRNDLQFKGLVVLDTKDWAANFNVDTMKQVIAHDASLLGGTGKVVFSNHWYPNIPLTKVTDSINNSNQVPILIGEIGQYNATPDDPQYVKDALAGVVNTGINNGHNGVFPWMWAWCDTNNMTKAWDNLVDLSTFGQLLVDNYYTKVSNSTIVPDAPTATPVASPSTTPSPIAPTPTPSPKLASPTPVPSPIGDPRSELGYPKVLPGTNAKITLTEVKAPADRNVFIKADFDSSVTGYQVDWYINDRWTTQDKTAPFYLGGDTNGAPNGFPMPLGNNNVRAVVYFSGQSYIDSRVTYTVEPLPTPTPNPQNGVVTGTVEIFNEWNKGYCARIVIKNNSNVAVKSWKFYFNLNQARFTSKWNASFFNLLGRITVTPNDNVKYLPAYGTNNATDYCADKKGTNWRPSNFSTSYTQ